MGCRSGLDRPGRMARRARAGGELILGPVPAVSARSASHARLRSRRPRADTSPHPSGRSPAPPAIVSTYRKRPFQPLTASQALPSVPPLWLFAPFAPLAPHLKLGSGRPIDVAELTGGGRDFDSRKRQMAAGRGARDRSRANSALGKAPLFLLRFPRSLDFVTLAQARSID